MDKSENGVIAAGFGDWCLPNDNTWETVGECKAAVNTSLLYFYCSILEEISPLIGKKELTGVYGCWKNTIKTGYYNYCIEKYGCLREARQPDIILPLYFGLFDGDIRKEAETALTDKLISSNHLDTGGFGTMALISAAAAAGGIDLIHELLQEGSYPGFGFWMVNGATSLWEQWAVKGIMHSHSHAMYSGIDASFYNTLCGIKPIEKAFRKITIEPVVPDDMQFCSCLLQTVSGDIEVSLERLYHGLEISLTIPPNVRAVLHIPEYKKFDDCSLFDGERKTEKKQDLNVGGGYYRFRLVPEKYIK